MGLAPPADDMSERATRPALLLCASLCLIGHEARAMGFPDADWEVRTPASQGLDQTGLDEAVAYLGQELAATGGITELVIIRNGYLVHAGSDIDRHHCVWSATKSFTSTVLGHLIDAGQCTLDTLGQDHVSLLADDYSGVTLRHFATMTSGYDAVGGTYGDDPDDGSETPLVPAAPAAAPGSQFSYFDDAMGMNGYVLTMIAGTDLESYFRAHIGDAIGIPATSFEWLKTVTGAPPPPGMWDNPDGVDVRNAPGGVFISARELSRLGHLFLNQGKWRDQQVVSASWVQQATQVQVPPTMAGREDSPRQQRLSASGIGRYGYNWWVNGIGQDGTRLWPDAPPDTYAASGYNNNKCYVVPKWNVVVVRMGTAGSPADSHGVWSTFLGMLGDAITDGDAGSVTGFTLVDADTDEDIGPLTDGDWIAASGRLALRANTSPAQVGSVRFWLDDDPRYSVDDTAPYALAGDTGGDYAAWSATLGQHVLTAVPYAGPAGTGTAGEARSVTFEVYMEPDGGTPPDGGGGDAGVAEAGAGPGEAEEDCACAQVGRATPPGRAWWVSAVALLLGARRRHRSRRSRGD